MAAASCGRNFSPDALRDGRRGMARAMRRDLQGTSSHDACHAQEPQERLQPRRDFP
ncbi:hypothetical protein NB709_001964 [Xanthomonas sacchari]|nr:hypothetical protein [Xanthomonas sacchari]